MRISIEFDIDDGTIEKLENSSVYGLGLPEHMETVVFPYLKEELGAKNIKVIQNKKEIESMKNNEKEIKAEENGNEKYSKGLDALKYEVYTIDTDVTTAAFENPLDAEIFVAYLNQNVTPSAIRPRIKSNIIKAEEGYQGWSNHATWVINLHLDNEQSAQEMKKEIILETRNEDKEKWIYDAAETLKSWVEDTMPELPPMWADMLNGYFDEVDFREIAEHGIDEIGYDEENEKNKGKDLKKEFE